MIKFMCKLDFRKCVHFLSCCFIVLVLVRCAFLSHVNSAYRTNGDGDGKWLWMIVISFPKDHIGKGEGDLLISANFTC